MCLGDGLDFVNGLIEVIWRVIVGIGSGDVGLCGCGGLRDWTGVGGAG